MVELRGIKQIEKNNKNYSYVCCIYPCTPFLEVEDLQITFKMLVNGNKKFIYPISKYETPIQRALERNEDIAEWALNIGYNSCVKSIVLVPGSAIASSGELFQGSHIIEPAEGGQSAWKRSYAMAGTGSLADAASTAALVLGDKEIESICEQEDGLSFAVFSEETGHDYGSFFNTEICET